jgi:hypothetical protein
MRYDVDQCTVVLLPVSLFQLASSNVYESSPGLLLLGKESLVCANEIKRLRFQPHFNLTEAHEFIPRLQSPLQPALTVQCPIRVW